MLWPFEINWERDVVERLEYLTNVLLARDDTEQRIQLRSGARRSLRFNTLVGSDIERTRYENTLIAGQPNTFELPLFMDAAWITTPIIDAEIVVASLDSTAFKSFVNGGQVLLMNAQHWKIADVTTFDAATITLTHEDGIGDWPLGTKIIPLVPARLNAAQPLRYLTDNVMTAEVEFALVDEWQGDAVVEANDFNGYPVYLNRSDFSEDITASIERNLNVFDNQVGAIEVTDIAGLHRFSKNHRWVLGSHVEIATFKQWLSQRVGRLNPFYLLSHSQDFVVQNPIASDAVFFSVANAGHALVVNETGRRDICIQLNNGTRFYRRITAVDVINSTTETVTINAALGVAITPADIRCVSYLRLMRLASDSIELAYKSDGVVTVALGLLSVRDSNNE